MKATEEVIPSRDSSTRAGRIRLFQESLNRAVVLLLEIKGLPGVPQGMKAEIDRMVDDLQNANVRLPELVSTEDGLAVLFRIIEMLKRLWQKLFGD